MHCRAISYHSLKPYCQGSPSSNTNVGAIIGGALGGALGLLLIGITIASFMIRRSRRKEAALKAQQQEEFFKKVLVFDYEAQYSKYLTINSMHACPFCVKASRSNTFGLPVVTLHSKRVNAGYVRQIGTIILNRLRHVCQTQRYILRVSRAKVKSALKI